MIHVAIIAGGKGERFWPFSTRENPKQLLKIASDKTMLEETLDRVSDFVPLERTVIVTGENIRKQIVDRHPTIKDSNILAEPFGKNTCLAVGFAAIHLFKKDPEGVMVVLSADHFIRPKERLIDILRFGAAIAERDDVLITIGINPTRPETGYGYIELGEQYDSFDGLISFKVKQFKEKPNRTLAQQYYIGRMHMWNSGMFIWSTKAILNAISRCKPEMHRLLIEYGETIGTAGELKARQELFERAEGVSIDVGVLEEANNVVVIKADLIWDDIGSWLALERISSKDKDNNVSIGDTILHESFEISAVNAGEGILATLGISDLVVVKTDSVVLVAHKTRVNDIKTLLARMKDDPRYDKYL